MPCPVAQRAPRAGQRPRPWPGEGRPGGAGRRLRPYFGGPPAFLPGDRDVHLWMGLIWGPPRSKESLGRGSVSRPSLTPFFGEAICLGIGPAFVHFWVRIRGRRRIGVSSPPHFLSLDSTPGRVFGNWGDGACPCDLRLGGGGASSLKEIFPDKGRGTPLWPFLGVWVGHFFHGACLKAHCPIPFEASRAKRGKVLLLGRGCDGSCEL